MCGGSPTVGTEENAPQAKWDDVLVLKPRRASAIDADANIRVALFELPHKLRVRGSHRFSLCPTLGLSRVGYGVGSRPLFGSDAVAQLFNGKELLQAPQ
jgi:hypothetical protein